MHLVNMKMTPTDLKSFPSIYQAQAFDDFKVGRVIRHGCGRTVTEADTVLYCTLLHQAPIYTDRQLAAHHGYSALPLHPYLLFSIAFGLTVADLSESGGAFLGVDRLSFERDAYPGVTMRVISTVLSARKSKSDERYGVVCWQTRATNEHGDPLLTFERVNKIPTRAHLESMAA